jgi:chitodextrinase
MPITRRSFLTTVAAGTTLGVLGVPRSAGASVLPAASPAGDVVGKITVGYQGWFACTGDGAPINGWWHWSNSWGQPPSPTNNGTLRAWPDMREYQHAYQTAYAPCPNGSPATLFSSYDQQTVDTHFRWMHENNIDTAALQRFNPFGGEGPTRDAMAAKVRSAAESNNVKFYIMYDATGWADMQSQMKQDWTQKMSAHTSSPMYARQNGKPVVCIWGFGYNDANHPWSQDGCLDVINWFKGQGVYLIGGTPREWRESNGGSRPGYGDVYRAFNMISPWMVGAISNVADSDWMYQNMNVPDAQDCQAHGIDYQPCVLPGDVSGRQRTHGDFMWHQFYNMIRAGAGGIYISMYDEFNEGNQILKTAETTASMPSNSGLLALDEDGTHCTSDYYLRLTGDGGRMLKGQIALTAVRPTQPGGTGGGTDTQAPTVPANLRVTGHTSSSASLAWDASSDNVGVASYGVYRVDGGNRTSVGSTASTTFTVTGLQASTAYSFCVDARDATGNASAVSATVGVATDPGGATNLALHRPTAESSHTQNYASSNATDGDPNSYWESANNAFPQWLQVDLGVATAARRIGLSLPPAPAWGRRTQTLSVQGSTDGATFQTLVGSAGYTFDPATGNTATVALPASTQARYLRLNFTANTGWPAGQVAELAVFTS